MQVCSSRSACKQPYRLLFQRLDQKPVAKRLHLQQGKLLSGAACDASRLQGRCCRAYPRDIKALQCRSWRSLCYVLPPSAVCWQPVTCRAAKLRFGLGWQLSQAGC